MPVLAVNFTITAPKIKTKENTFVECYDEWQFNSKEIFLERQKNTVSNKPFLWCFIIIKVSICHRLCCEYTQHLCGCWVLKKLPISYAAAWGRERPSPSLFLPLHTQPLPAFHRLLSFRLCFGFSFSLLQFHYLHLGQAHLSEISCVGLTAGQTLFGPTCQPWSSYFTWKVVLRRKLTRMACPWGCLRWPACVSTASHSTCEQTWRAMYAVVVRDFSGFQSRNPKGPFLSLLLSLPPAL